MGELKINRSNGKSKIINADSKSRCLDLRVNGSLFVEAVGRDSIVLGWYELLV